jgi:hypothetical protein
VLLPRMVCNALVACGRSSGAGQQLCVRDEGSCSTGPGQGPKHVEQIMSAINHSVASSWFFSPRIYNDARTNTHQILTTNQHCIKFQKCEDLNFKNMPYFPSIKQDIIFPSFNVLARGLLQAMLVRNPPQQTAKLYLKMLW